MAVNTWIAASAGNASTDANWSLGHAPLTGEDVVFDGTSTNNCAWDIASTTAVPNSITLAAGYTGTVTQGAVDIGIGAGGFAQAAGRFTGSSNWVICQGGFAHTGGALSVSKPHLEMSGNDTTLRLSDYDKIGKLKITGERVNFQAPVIGCEVDDVFTNTGSVILSGTFNLPTHLLPASTIGNISGTGTLSLRYYNTNSVIPATTITCNLKIWSLGSATQNGTMTLGGAVSCNGLEVFSDHATYTITLATSTYNLTCGALTLGARGVISQGTGTLTCSSYTQNGASSVFTQGGPVSVTGDTVISDGTLTGNTSYTWTNGGNFVRTGGTITADVLRLTMAGNGKNLTGTTNLASIRFSGNTTLTDNSTTSANATNVSVTIDAGVSLNIASGATFTINEYLGRGLAVGGNFGSIVGAGTVFMRFYNESKAFNLGVIKCGLIIKLHSSASSAQSLTLTGNPDLGALTIQSDNDTYAMTLDLAGYNLNARGITVGTRGVLLGGEGVIRNYGNLDTSAGTWTPETCQYVQAGSGTIKTAAGQTLNDVEAPSAPLDLASDVTITGKYRHLRSAKLNGFTLTFDPSKEVRMLDDMTAMSARRTRIIAVAGGP